jgi:hypothetical protein
MNIVETYSHLNGLEFLKIHRNELWHEINTAIRSLGSDASKVRDFKDDNTAGYSLITLNDKLKKILVALGWKEDHKSKSKYTTELNEFEEGTPCSFNGTKLIKERVAIEIMLNKYCFESPVLFARHLVQYVVDMIDVGISILPMKSLQVQMSSGVPYYEGELYNVIRQGRGVPAVPLVIVGIMP